MKRWGLNRSFEKTVVSPWKYFNARSESIAIKPMFQSLLLHQKRRCVVPVDGIYEFKKETNGTKQPYYLQHSDNNNSNNNDKKHNKVLLLAALYDVWTPPPSTSSSTSSTDVNMPLHSFTLLTMDACPKISSWLHHRQPVILTNDLAREWLNPSSTVNPTKVLSDILSSEKVSNPSLMWHPVSNQINSGSYQGIDSCISSKKRKGSIMSFFNMKKRKATNKEETEKKVKKKVKMEKKEQTSMHSGGGGGWCCRLCTFVNKSIVLRCEMCQHIK
jgi:putative SOS response-associated peptidase YedK